MGSGYIHIKKKNGSIKGIKFYPYDGTGSDNNLTGEDAYGIDVNETKVDTFVFGTNLDDAQKRRTDWNSLMVDGGGLIAPLFTKNQFSIGAYREGIPLDELGTFTALCLAEDENNLPHLFGVNTDGDVVVIFGDYMLKDNSLLRRLGEAIDMDVSGEFFQLLPEYFPDVLMDGEVGMPKTIGCMINDNILTISDYSDVQDGVTLISILDRVTSSLRFDLTVHDSNYNIYNLIIQGDKVPYINKDGIDAAFPTGTLDITKGGNYDVKDYEYVEVNVESGEGIKGVRIDEDNDLNINLDTVIAEHGINNVYTSYNGTYNTNIRNELTALFDGDFLAILGVDYNYKIGALTNQLDIIATALTDNVEFENNGDILSAYLQTNMDLTLSIGGKVVDLQKFLAFKENDKTYILGYQKETDSIIALEDGKSLIGTGTLGDPIIAATEAEADALVINEQNNGKIFRYTGTTGKYENGELYVIEV